MFACKSDVFKGDIVRFNNTYYVVIDGMNNNAGNFRAKDSKGRMIMINTKKIYIIKRKNTDFMYI